MNNLYRQLAPVTEAAWAEIEEEASRTFKRHIAGRRVVDVSDAAGPTAAAVGTGRLVDVTAPSDGVVAQLRDSKPLVRLRVPFTLSRSEIDDVERGSNDADFDPVKQAATKLAFVEDRAIFEGYEAASIEGIRAASSNPALTLPADPREMPDVISQALSELRLAGVDGPYSVLLSADAYTQVSETTQHGYPIREHLRRLVGDGEIIWAPAIDGAFVVTTRGGDFALSLGTDVSIGYLNHDDQTVQLYLQETLTFSCYTAEAAVCLRNPAPQG
ncbi:encapsulin [Mycolicibacillus parakoreensis]|uniref:Type 1 encapsulin shell protein n=1 Tax=Mycolicibacillus parakoreensis TaxID=1069221 RepID=A0ABY3U2B1_9MYCO|nr:family 1 encapsulin nanocompartment shell protein [Mycolicibacillus parakoreensis]MCV7314353.1 encapsulin [Mycolicibacillus parakoreensis]ULN53299.1 encapsulin [Mycolicibacillus parakoreensis]HLS00050.1 family 1 encapsulin nanocompartment shell protein [Mycolicibacillus parakoreensis]